MEKLDRLIYGGSAPSYHTCKHCQRLVIVFNDGHRDEFGIQSYNVVFEAAYKDIIEAANEDCTLCQYLIAKSPPYSIELYRDIVLAAIVKDGFSEITFMWWSPETKNMERQIGSCLKVSLSACLEGTTRRLRISGPINRTPGSGKSFKLYRKWLRECQEHHKDCVQLKQSYLPKRLIRVRRDREIWHLSLQETCGLRKEAYVALSYCWGGDQPIKTTKETLDCWTDKILMSDLPFTLQDAIITTNEMGLSFLWIDALCIMQDDPDEMAQEISQMPQIYEKASFVLVASRAGSVRDGFLKPREVLHYLKPSCGLSFKDVESGDHGVITLYQRPRLGPLPEGTREPLDDRAWPLQERLLACRILEFGNSQTSWFCHQSKDQSLEGMYSDGWQEVSNDGRSAVGLQQEFFALNYKAESSVASISAAQKSLVKTWENLIGMYTSRKLSNTEDRSLAISGIAEKFASAFLDDYICGLWKLTFPRALLWRVLTPCRRPQSFQGPSWSWTSVNGSVSLDNLSSDDFVHHESHLELLHWDIKLAHEKAPFGGVIFGHLWVKGLLRPAYLVYDQKLKICHLEGVGGPLHASFEKDCLEEVSMDSSGPTLVYLLSVISLPLSYRSQEYGAYGAKGLVLRALEKQKFLRLGLFQFARYRREKMEQESEEEWNRRWELQKSWFDGCKPEIITLI